MLVASIDTNFGRVFETTVLWPRGAVPRPRPLVRITETQVVVHSHGVGASAVKRIVDTLLFISRYKMFHFF